MTIVKRLLLGTAAGLVAVTGAQAADLPVKAKAVEYVKICSLYGAGFYYIPGTDTCIKLGGYSQLDVTFNGQPNGQPPWRHHLQQRRRFPEPRRRQVHHPYPSAVQHRHPHRDGIRRCPHLLVEQLRLFDRRWPVVG
jgi:hypothetical protein